MVSLHLKFPPGLAIVTMQVHCSLNKGAAVFRGGPHTLPSDLQATTGDTVLRSYLCVSGRNLNIS